MRENAGHVCARVWLLHFFIALIHCNRLTGNILTIDLVYVSSSGIVSPAKLTPLEASQPAVGLWTEHIRMGLFCRFVNFSA